MTSLNEELEDVVAHPQLVITAIFLVLAGIMLLPFEKVFHDEMSIRFKYNRTQN